MIIRMPTNFTNTISYVLESKGSFLGSLCRKTAKVEVCQAQVSEG